MKEHKTPNRMCIACRQMKAKTELLRIVKRQDRAIQFDATGKADGRGAYVCNLEDCIFKLKKTRLLNKAWKMDVPLNIYEQLEEAFIAKK